MADTGFRPTLVGHTEDPDKVADFSRQCVWARWPGDPYPEAQAEFRRASAVAGNAWQAIADAAQSNANGCRITMGADRGEAEFREMLKTAVEATEARRKAHVAARTAEDARRPPERAKAGCSGCYQSLSGPWCDNCDQWPCVCEPT